MNYIQAAGFQLYDCPPSQSAINQILSDPFATKSLLEDKTKLLPGDYYTVQTMDQFLGLIWIQHFPEGIRAIHPMLLSKSKPHAITLIELTIQYLHCQNLKPVATVADTKEFAAIQNFLNKRITPTYQVIQNETGQAVRVYRVPSGWTPLTFDSFFLKRN